MLIVLQLIVFYMSSTIMLQFINEFLTETLK